MSLSVPSHSYTPLLSLFLSQCVALVSHAAVSLSAQLSYSGFAVFVVDSEQM